MYYVYIIENLITNHYYIGCTKNHRHRWSSHLCKANTERPDSKLYMHFQEYGPSNLEMSLIDSFDDKHEAYNFEESCIDLDDPYCLNTAKGGVGGFCVPEEKKDAWRKKLSSARQHKKPALGMRHSDENKKLFARKSKEYWDTQDTYKASEILKYGFSEANKVFGISKTHYYRLRKRAEVNALG